MHLVRARIILLLKGESRRRKGKGKAGESEAKLPRHSHDLTATSACGCGNSDQVSEQIFKGFQRASQRSLVGLHFWYADLDLIEPHDGHIALFALLRPA